MSSLRPLFDLFAHFLGHCFGLIPAPGSFVASAFPVPPSTPSGPSQNAAPRFGSRSPRFWVPQENGAEKGETQMYLNSVTIVGFVGADPEQRQARKNGTKFTVLSVATQRSWKNTEDEWVSKTEWHRVCYLPSASGRIRSRIGQERFARPRRRQPHQFYLRATERQGEESRPVQDHVLVHSRRRRAQPRSRRTGTGNNSVRFPRRGRKFRSERRSKVLTR